MVTFASRMMVVHALLARRSLHRILAVASLCLAASLAPLDAQDWDPFPRLRSGQQVGIKPNLESQGWDTLRRCLGDKKSVVGAKYYAAVVEVSAFNGSDSPEFANAVPYVDALYESWRRRLNPETHVLIVMALGNRAVAIHPGTRWADLGFVHTNITATIDTSDFKLHARGGDHDLAVCALVDAVDDKLGALQDRVDARREAIRAQIEGLQERADAMEERLGTTEFAGPLAESTYRALEAINLGLSAGRRLLETRRLGEAEASMPRLAGDIDQAVRLLDAFEAVRERLPILHASLAEREAALLTAHGMAKPSFDKTRGAITTCSERVAALASGIETGQNIDVAAVDQCLADIDREFEFGQSMYRLRYVVLPRVVGAILSGLVLAFLILRRRRCHRASRRMEEELERWQTTLNNAADRLLRIESEHPLYFVAEPWRWEGESQELDRACADSVNLLYLIYSRAFELNDKARRMADEARSAWFRARPYDRVWEVLRNTDVRFETGEVETKRRIFLPLRREFQTTAKALLDDLDNAYEDARTRLDEVTQLDEAYRHLKAKTAESVETIRAAIDTREDLELSATHLLDVLALRVEELDGIESHRRDPLKANAAFEILIKALTALREQAESGNRTVERLRGPVPERGRELREEVERLRQLGYQLEEPGFQPDVELDRGVREARKIIDRVAAGEEKRAASRLDQLEKTLETLGENLETIERAREGIPSDLELLADTLNTIEQRIPDVRAILKRLRREHVVRHFEVEADNLDDLESVLGSIRSQLRAAKEDFEAEHYLASLAKLEDIFTLTDRGHDLLDEIESAKERLDAVRGEATDALARCVAVREELPNELRRGGLGQDLRQHFGRWGEEVEALVRRSEVQPLDWLELGDDLDEAEHQLAGLRSEAEHLAAEYVRCQTSARALREQWGTLARQVDIERRDRRHVAEAVAQSDTLLREFEAALEQNEESGRELAARLASIETSIHQARQVWTSEMELVKTVEQRIKAARQLLRHISYDAGRRAIDSAESLAASKLWDEALSEAHSAYRQIEREIRRREEEERRRREEEARRRRIEAARRREEEAHRRREERDEARRFASSYSNSSSLFSSSNHASARSTRPSSGSSSSSSSRSSSSPRPSRSRRSRPKARQSNPRSGGSSFSGSNSGGSSW